MQDTLDKENYIEENEFYDDFLDNVLISKYYFIFFYLRILFFNL